jgi:2-phospho-L-lactate/phosphoenolpyruvate guanylyltransferase
VQVIAVPVKALGRSKSRLAPTLAPAERATLTLALLDDVLRAATAQSAWEVWVISADRAVLKAAAGWGARPVTEQGRTLLQAVRQVEEELRGSGELAVLLGDLPYLRAGELERALATAGPVVAAPAASDGGTNLLLRRPPSVIPARFGRASFAKHAWAARRARVDLVEVRAPGLELDLDGPEDVAALLASTRRGRARAACVEMGLEARLGAPTNVATKG